MSVYERHEQYIFNALISLVNMKAAFIPLRRSCGRCLDTGLCVCLWMYPGFNKWNNK